MSGTAFSIAIFIALCGQFVFNKVMGILFDSMHFDWLPAVMAIAIVMIMILNKIKHNVSFRMDQERS